MSIVQTLQSLTAFPGQMSSSPTRLWVSALLCVLPPPPLYTPHLNGETCIENPLWSGAGVLCHSSQTCCCRWASMRTPFQPTSATGPHHPCSSKGAVSLQRGQYRSRLGQRAGTSIQVFWAGRERLQEQQLDSPAQRLYAESYFGGKGVAMILTTKRTYVSYVGIGGNSFCCAFWESVEITFRGEMIFFPTWRTFSNSELIIKSFLK